MLFIKILKHGLRHFDLSQIEHGVESLMYHASLHGHLDDAQRFLGLYLRAADHNPEIARRAAQELLVEVGKIRRNPLLVLDDHVNDELWDPNQEPVYHS